MKKTTLSVFTAIALLGTAVTGVAIADSDHNKYSGKYGDHHGQGQHKGMNQGKMDQGMMGGKSLFAEKERNGFRESMRESETQEERQEIRNTMRETMKQRAKEKGIELGSGKGHHGKGSSSDCLEKGQKS
jgi:Spy/CpxP family protein refolding chaperone